MFAIVRTGGKQYRVAAGDKIAVEKLAGEAGETITLGDVLMAGEGGDMADAAKVVVSAEIIAQAKSEKVIVFKKRRRHNYRRRNGHRQQLTLLRILSVGDAKPAKKAKKHAKKQAKHLVDVEAKQLAYLAEIKRKREARAQEGRELQRLDLGLGEPVEIDGDAVPEAEGDRGPAGEVEAELGGDRADAQEHVALGLGEDLEMDRGPRHRASQTRRRGSASHPST